jgi:hypothetical protein
MREVYNAPLKILTIYCGLEPIFCGGPVFRIHAARLVEFFSGAIARWPFHR